MNLDLNYLPKFLDTEEASKYFERLAKELPWDQGHIKIFGKVMAEPRLKSWHSVDNKSYRYSGQTLQAKPMHPTLTEILEKIIKSFPDHKHNSVLANLYRNQTDSMGWHADDEAELGPNPLIASINLGAEREILFRKKNALKGERSSRILLEHGSLLLMGASIQNEWVHSIPKRKNTLGARINLTYRTIF